MMVGGVGPFRLFWLAELDLWLNGFTTYEERMGGNWLQTYNAASMALSHYVLFFFISQRKVERDVP